MSLEQFIKENYESKADFARKQGVLPQQITDWVNKGFIVVGGKLYSPRRELA